MSLPSLNFSPVARVGLIGANSATAAARKRVTGKNWVSVYKNIKDQLLLVSFFLAITIQYAVGLVSAQRGGAGRLEVEKPGGTVFWTIFVSFHFPPTKELIPMDARPIVLRTPYLHPRCEGIIFPPSLQCMRLRHTATLQFTFTSTSRG